MDGDGEFRPHEVRWQKEHTVALGLPGTGTTVVILTNQDRVLVPAIQRTEAILTG